MMKRKNIWACKEGSQWNWWSKGIIRKKINLIKSQKNRSPHIFWPLSLNWQTFQMPIIDFRVLYNFIYIGPILESCIGNNYLHPLPPKKKKKKKAK